MSGEIRPTYGIFSLLSAMQETPKRSRLVALNRAFFLVITRLFCWAVCCLFLFFCWLQCSIKGALRFWDKLFRHRAEVFDFVGVDLDRLFIKALRMVWLKGGRPELHALPGFTFVKRFSAPHFVWVVNHLDVSSRLVSHLAPAKVYPLHFSHLTYEKKTTRFH